MNYLLNYSNLDCFLQKQIFDILMVTKIFSSKCPSGHERSEEQGPYHAILTLVFALWNLI